MVECDTVLGGFGLSKLGWIIMLGQSIRRGVCGALAATGLSTLACAAGFQSEDAPLSSAAPRDVMAVTAPLEESLPRFVQDTALSVVRAEGISAAGCSFASGARSIGLHVKIVNTISSKRSVTLTEVKLMLDALEVEQGNTITRSFYEGYAKSFAGTEVRNLVVEHLKKKALYPELVGELTGESVSQVAAGTFAADALKSVSTQGAFRAVDTTPIALSGMTFQANSSALKLHQAISADIQRGRHVPRASLKALFVALSAEDLRGLGDRFFAEYAKKFKSADAVKLMMEGLIPVVEGKLALPRGDASAHRLAALRVLGNSFPEGTPLPERREFFEARRNDGDLNVRALGLMLCINANLKPAADYLPSEVVRASQQLGYMNRLRGDEFRLGIMLRDSIQKWGSDFSIDKKTLNQIKMPLLRRAQTIERRHPGTTEALLVESESPYVAFLEEHARVIEGARNALADEVFLGSDRELHTILHSAPEFHDGPSRDIAKAFRLAFDPARQVIKGEASMHSAVGEQGYFGLMERLSKEPELQKRALIWLNMHGNSDGAFFTRGEAQDATGDAQSQTVPLPTEFIACEEEAFYLLRSGGLADTWLIVDTCEGWNYSEQVNEQLISAYLKELPIERVVAERRIPGRVIGSQCQMLSVGNIVEWYNEDLPAEQQKRMRTSYSKLMFEVMAYCQAKSMGVSVEDLTTIGATEKPFECTFADLYEVDERLASDKEATLKQWWHGQEGKIFDYLKTNRIDASVKDSTLIDIDKMHQEVLQRLKDRGWGIPDPKSNVQPIRRNSDYVHEISSIEMPCDVSKQV
jgi:hypothetical protein